MAIKNFYFIFDEDTKPLSTGFIKIQACNEDMAINVLNSYWNNIQYKRCILQEEFSNLLIEGKVKKEDCQFCVLAGNGCIE